MSNLFMEIEFYQPTRCIEVGILDPFYLMINPPRHDNERVFRGNRWMEMVKQPFPIRSDWFIIQLIANHLEMNGHQVPGSNTSP